MPKISELTAGTTPTGAEKIAAVQGTSTVRLLLSQVLTYIAGATKTLTNTTFDTAGTGNSLSINGVAASANTGTGSVVRATSPTLVTPALGTPSAVVLTNGTGLPISTGVSGLAANVAAFLATPSSANLAASLTDETGSGAAVFATSPTLVTPALGTPSAAVLTNATGLPLTTGVTGTLPVANAPSIHGADIASASTINLETATGDCVDVTGTTTITAITLSDGHERTVRFTGILTLTNGASLVLPGGSNIITAAGDYAVFRGYAAGVVRCVSYQMANAFEEVSTTVTFAAPFAAAATGSAGFVWNTVSIPRAGLWEVGGNTGVTKTGGTTPTYTHMHADNNVIAQTTIQTAPGNGTTIAMHITSNDSNGWLFAHAPVLYRTTGAVTVNFVATVDYTGGTCGMYGRSYARRVAP